MKIPKGLKIPQFWSVSRYNVWRQCSYKYYLQHIVKVPTPDFPAMVRGIKIHKFFEEVLKKKITGLPDELEKLRKEIMKLKRLGVDPEVNWTITKDLEITHAKDWDHAWCRAKIDAHHYFEEEEELVIIDLKTGRVNLAIAQMELYAWLSRFFYPDAKNIVVELWFSDHGEIETIEYTPKEADRIGKKWMSRVSDMLGDRKFLPSPGDHCSRCSFRSSLKMPNGEFGPCQAWKTTSI